MSGTHGRVYGGDPALVHIPDGKRQDVGKLIAQFAELQIRLAAGDESGKPICPGCYMVAMYNACLELARRNGQDTDELCASMAAAFQGLSTDPRFNREEINVRATRYAA